MKTMNPKGKILIAVIFLYFQLNAQSAKILHNHIGYETTAPKSGVVLSKETDKVTSFAIIDYTTGIKIMEGNPKYIGTVDKWRDWHFWTFSFDAVAVTGTYIIECQINGGAVRSFPFVIQDNLLERNTLSDVVYYFKGQRSSGLLDKADREMTFDKGKKDTVDVHGGWYDATGDY